MPSPHDLADVIDRMVNTVPHHQLSWADVCRVADYVGPSWPTACKAHRGAYGLAVSILDHLEEVDRARAEIAAYTTVACSVHDAPIGKECSSHQAWLMNLRLPPGQTLAFPTIPSVCTHRVLTKHGLLAAMELFERRRRSDDRLTEPCTLPLPNVSEDERLIAGAQYRHPRSLIDGQIFVLNPVDWTIVDVRVGGVSIFTPYHDLPGYLFGGQTSMGPYLPLPVIEQDQWVEVEVRRAKGSGPRFLPIRAYVTGSRAKGEDMDDMSDFVKKQREQREQEVMEHLAACDRIRRKLELPVETLDLIDRSLRGESPLGQSGRFTVPRSLAEPPSAVTRAPLRLVSEKKIRRTNPTTEKPTSVTVRPQTIAMRIEEIEVLSSPDEWMIADIQVGGRTQFPQVGPPLPGRLFTPGGTCHHFVTETAQTAMDVTLLVHYVGAESEGKIFEAVAMGTTALC